MIESVQIATNRCAPDGAQAINMVIRNTAADI